MILVVKPRPGELFNEFHFWGTNADAALYTRKELAELYSACGKAEMHQGEIKQAGSLSLSSSQIP